MSGVELLYKLTSQSIKYGLERTEKLLQACGNPHDKLKIIQIAGTNGKGTTSAMIANVLINNNYKTGLFTSPHLVSLHERIQVSYHPINDSFIDEFISSYYDKITHIQPSFFEVITVMALSYFVKKKVDIAILETGLGGRLDSVTATQPNIVIYTSIDYDHMHILGDTIEEIAYEKAGAITKKSDIIISCKQKKSVMRILDKYAAQYSKKVQFNTEFISFPPINFYGKHQSINAQLAYFSIKHLTKYLNFSILNIKQYIAEAFWPGRIQFLKNSPDIIFDVAHNVQSIESFIEYFQSIYKQYKSTNLVIAFENTKQVNSSIVQLGKYFKNIILTETKIKNSMPAIILYKIMKKNEADVKIIKNPITAIQKTADSMSSKDCLVILGSHYFGPYINQIFKNCFDIDIKQQ